MRERVKFYEHADDFWETRARKEVSGSTGSDFFLKRLIQLSTREPRAQ